jgi:hypothetical protein
VHLVGFTIEIHAYNDARSYKRQKSLHKADSKLQHYYIMCVVGISGEEFINTRSRKMWINFYMIGTLL